MDDSNSELVILDETGSESDGNDKKTKNPSNDKNNGTESDKDVIILDEYTEKSSHSRRSNYHERSSSKHRKRCSSCDHEAQIKRLRKENYNLRSELSSFRKRFNICVGGIDNDLIRVDFKSEDIFKKYRNDVESFLNGLLPKQIVTNFKQEGVETLFCVDNACNSSRLNNNSKNWQVPLYCAEYSEALVDKEQEEKDRKVKDDAILKPRSTCFNCMGDHMLIDCPLPQDRHQISKNRKEFYAKFGGKTSRYHIENDPRFSKYKAGFISNDLRKALKLEKHQLPPYIYKMRALGYPPGWLLEAQVSSSGITMYDSQGKEVIDENLEEGEVSEPGEAKIQYDPSKLVEYPGFNVYPEAGLLDEHQKFGSVPMQEHQLKSYFELHMKMPETRPFYRRKSQTQKEPKEKTPSRNEEDMEIEDNQGDGAIITDFDGDSEKCVFIPPLPREPLEVPPPPPPPPPPPSEEEPSEAGVDKKSVCAALAASDANIRKQSQSPTLEDLEHQKQHLMMQLQQKIGDDPADSVSSTGEYLETSSQDSSTSVLDKQTNPITPMHPTIRRLTATSASSETGTSDSELSSSEMWIKATRSASKNIVYGTPVLSSRSPYSTLPTQTMFSKGISEHLPFDNLPDSTGHYEKFKNVLKKIRSKSIP